MRKDSSSAISTWIPGKLRVDCACAATADEQLLPGFLSP